MPRGRPKGETRLAQERLEEGLLARDVEMATLDPKPFLGDAYYYTLVRENVASEALANAAAALVHRTGESYRRVLIAALAGAAKHAKHYHATMTPKRRDALQAIKDAQEMLAKAWKDLREAEAEDGAFPAEPFDQPTPPL